MNKDIFFYSNHCEYCKEILNYMTQHNLKPLFLHVCVDNPRYRLPDFVDRVPLIYTKTQHVLTDQSITDYLDDHRPKAKDIEPFSLMQGTANYSDMFSFLDSSEEGVVKGYTYLGSDQPIPMVAEEVERGNSSKAKFDSAVLEKYMAERDNDIKRIIGNGNPIMRF